MILYNSIMYIPVYSLYRTKYIFYTILYCTYLGILCTGQSIWCCKLRFSHSSIPYKLKKINFSSIHWIGVELIFSSLSPKPISQIKRLFHFQHYKFWYSYRYRKILIMEKQTKYMIEQHILYYITNKAKENLHVSYPLWQQTWNSYCTAD